MIKSTQFCLSRVWKYLVKSLVAYPTAIFFLSLSALIRPLFLALPQATMRTQTRTERRRQISRFRRPTGLEDSAGRVRILRAADQTGAVVDGGVSTGAGALSPPPARRRDLQARGKVPPPPPFGGRNDQPSPHTNACVPRCVCQTRMYVGRGLPMARMARVTGLGQRPGLALRAQYDVPDLLRHHVPCCQRNLRGAGLGLFPDAGWEEGRRNARWRLSAAVSAGGPRNTRLYCL